VYALGETSIISYVDSNLNVNYILGARKTRESSGSSAARCRGREEGRRDAHVRFACVSIMLHSLPDDVI